ncbi:hypothetical protein PpBr36_01449 [Pyricularia pennisetigena]|uniref:hypothetical protein n=1 Tax=Pyricularia pennisetigena TaxID=1578925 RepID=UPI00114D7A83|nr:hypothetical protein PpBr36_01449 [Pyricularia pennisetigena]TLS27723.1 hypothetical protein PpBr36_01449 [Pyricularia pennisetigena]
MPPPPPPVRTYPQSPFLGSVRQQGVRAPSRVRSVANDAANNADQPNASPAATMVAAAATLASGLSPRPQKFSTNYGSEAFQPFSLDHSRNYAMQSTDLGSALARATRTIQAEKPKGDVDATGTENAAAPANSLLGKRKELDLAAGSRDPKRQKTTQEADELAGEDQRSAAAGPRDRRGTSASRQKSQEPPAAAGPSRSAESGTDGSASGSPTDGGSTLMRRTRRGAAKSSVNATAPTPPEPPKTWDDLPVSRQAQRARNTRSERPAVQPTQEETAIEEGDDVNMIDLEEELGDEEPAPQTPDRQNGDFLQVPDARSSVAPTEKSYNTESMIYRDTRLSTPQDPPSRPPSSPPVLAAPASGDAALDTSTPTEHQTRTSRGAGDPGDLATPSPEPNPPTNPAVTAANPGDETNAEVNIINPLNPTPLLRRTQLSFPRAQTPESQTYNWNSSPNHRGIRSHSDSPNSNRYVATHMSHNLESNYLAPDMSEYEDGHERATRARQQQIRNSLLPPDRVEDSEPIRDIGAAPARPDLMSGFVRAHTEAPEARIRNPAGARGLFALDNETVRSRRRESLFDGARRSDNQSQDRGAPRSGTQSQGGDALRSEAQPQSGDAPRGDIQSQGHGAPLNRRQSQGRDAPQSDTQTHSSKGKKLREWAQALGTGWTHLSGFIWTIFDTLSQWQAYLVRRVWDIVQALTKAPAHLASYLWKHFTLGRLLVPLLLAFMAIAIASSYDRPVSFEGISLNNGNRWHGWQDWKNNLGQLVSPSFGHSLPGTNGNYSKIVAAFKSHDKDIHEIKDKAMVQDAALAKLEQILPEFVRMPGDKVPHQFYVAVRDLMQKDPLIPTLDKEGNISEDHAKAIEKHITTFFWRWLKENSRQIRQIAGIGQDSQLSDEELNRVVRRVAEEKRFEVVSKDEFLQILKKQLTKHHDETASQMKDFEVKLVEFRRQLQQVMGKSSMSMSKEQMQQNLDKALHKFAGNALLESFAKGRIKATDEEVISAVNHFSIRSGAMIDVYRTSPAYKWPNKAHLGHKRFQTENKNGPIKSPIYAGSVLDPWEADGDCWCGGTGQSPNRRLKSTGETHKVPAMAADIAIMTKRVIPQVLRLEHISAKETVEPESMPKEVEVWIQLDEDQEMFDHALSWSMAYFPDVDRYDPLFADKFVKIGHFLYPNETEVGHSGENFYLPKDVYQFGFATTKFLIRAKNNYGADDHTCFYQLLLNGKLLPMDE